MPADSPTLKKTAFFNKYIGPRLFNITKLLCDNGQKVFLQVIFIFPKHGAMQVVLFNIIAFLLYGTLIIVGNEYFFLCVENIGRLRYIIPIIYKTVFVFKTVLDEPKTSSPHHLYGFLKEPVVGCRCHLPSLSIKAHAHDKLIGGYARIEEHFYGLIGRIL